MTDRFTRNTRQRQVILEELRRTHSHPTAMEVYTLVRRRLPHISLGTVYRNLTLLVEQGLIRRLEMIGSRARFDADSASHYHIRCLYCEHVDDLYITPRRLADEISRLIDGHRIMGHRLEFIGVCDRCQKSSAPGHGENMSTGKIHRSRRMLRSHIPDRDSAGE